MCAKVLNVGGMGHGVFFTVELCLTGGISCLSFTSGQDVVGVWVTRNQKKKPQKTPTKQHFLSFTQLKTGGGSQTQG